MSRPTRVILVSVAAAALSAALAACGTEKISVPQSDPTHRGAELFNQRCSGCHTFSYAATHGSAANVRTAMINNGPNFNVRCERPVTRVLYAIENGGFSGAIMPQNVVVGQDARVVAQFVAKYAGRQAPKLTGIQSCSAQAIGTLPTPGQSATTAKKSSPAAPAAPPGTGSPSAGNASKASANKGSSRRATSKPRRATSKPRRASAKKRTTAHP